MGSKTTLISRAGATRSSKMAVGLVLAVFAGTACWPFSDDSALAEMTVKRAKGSVVIIRGSETIEVEDQASLEPRDVVQTQSSGEALVRLEGARLLTLAPNSKVRVKDTSTVESQSGSLLAETKDPLSVLFGSVTASSSGGMMRVDRGVSTARIASYKGTVTVGAPGEERLKLSSLYQAAPSANLIPSAPAPYNLDVTDPWDRAYLEEVVELHEELDQLTAGLRTQIGSQSPGLDYFGGLARGEDVGFLRSYLRRPAVNLLVGFTIASHDTHRPLATSFREAFALYERGAKWAVAAAIMDVKLSAVLAQLEDIATVAVASSSTGESFTLASAVLSEAGEVPPSGGGGPGDPPLPPTTLPTDGGGGGSTTPPTQPPNPSDPPDECQSSASCEIGDIVDEVAGDPTPTPEPTDPPDDPPDEEGPLDILKGPGLLN